MPSPARPRAGRLGALAVGLLCLATPQVAAAQWETLPSGQWQYTTSYTTTGTFRCWQWMEYLPGVACESDGGSMTLQKDASAVTFSFHGFAGSQTFSRSASTVMQLGAIETRFSGPEPFAFPPVLGHLTGLGWLDLTLHVPGPTGAIDSHTVPYAAVPVGPAVRFVGCHIYFCTYVAPVAPNPAGNAQSLMAMFPRSELIPAADGRSLVRASVTVIPEPSTWTLMGTGLLLVGGVAARRRQRR